MNFEQKEPVDIVEVVYREREQFPPTYRYYVDPIWNTTRHALNHLTHTFETSKLVVNYIKKVKCSDKTGLLRFREFNQVELEKNVIVNYDVYNVLPPFRLEEYYDGIFLFIIFHDIKINIAISINGIVCKISNNIYKCKFNSGDKDVLISGKQFVIHFTPVSLDATDDLRLKITTAQDYLLLSLKVSQRVENSLLRKYHNTADESYNELLDVYNSLQETKTNYNFDLSKDLEKEFSKCNIEGVELGQNDNSKEIKIEKEEKKPLRFYRIENGAFKINEKEFDENFSLEDGELKIKVKMINGTHESFSLDQDGLKIVLEDFFLVVDDYKFRILVV